MALASGHRMRGLSLEERYWAKVEKTNDGCWGWVSGTDAFGYGRLIAPGGRKNLKAHRVSWELHNGPIPGGMCVLHRCDNPPCSNPDHLFLGTKADNVADMNAKGRSYYALRTHCPHGHEYTEENTLRRVSGARRCRECNRISSEARNRRHQLREAVE